MEKALRRRDWRFVLRLSLVLGVAFTGALLVLLLVSGVDVGGCAARGFGTLTGNPAATAP